MKHLIMTILLIVGMAGYAIADHHNETQAYTAIVPSIAIMEWVAEYIDTYEKGGIFIAVYEALMDGRTPNEIMDASMDIKTVNPMMTVAALYCASASPEDIRSAVVGSGISEGILVAGFEQAKTVCGDEITDVQAYTPVGVNFAGIPGGRGGGQSYGSVSTFTN